MEQNTNYRSYNSEINSDEIDFKGLINFLLRNRIFISSIALISFAFAFIYSLTLKKVWEGQFQIVLNSDKSSSFDKLNPALGNLLDLDQNNDSLKTQVGILESPSILMPIYDLVNENTKKNSLSFAKWQKNNLDIKLEKGTAILNIAYRDTNKEIILPALKKMSLIYQDYSSKGLKRNQELTNNYLNSQINFFRKKSSNSIKAAQNFAIDQDLIYLDTSDSAVNSDENAKTNKVDNFQTNILGSILNIEKVRVGAANQIRLINSQISKINELQPTDYENLQYFGSSIPALASEGLPESLKDIEKKLVELRTKYTEKDRSIIRLLEERKLTIDLLKSRAIKYLKVSKLEAEATMEATMRPKGVLLKYKELIREAARDEATLVSLENDLRKLQLLQAKISDPWELITNPTLLKKPGAPSNTKISIWGLLFGIIIGAFISYYKEFKTDKIYSRHELEKLLSLSLLENINKKNKFVNSKQIIFLKEFLKNQNAKNIAFISLEEINNSYLKNLIDYLSKETNLDSNINFIPDNNAFEEYKSADTRILFISPESSSRSKIKALLNRLKLL